ncbi:hypothetical protein cyc_08353 [Cyclospora cayetanensis]|uniref:Uncharacterized protein n=1 Tax=Cyclospora cayetanensis TaxID=88456 RepID=A0A1D3D2D0_9EIME|nr:hypothetical protein cyc_08353 [Cyclospora cayetanensis]
MVPHYEDIRYSITLTLENVLLWSAGGLKSDTASPASSLQQQLQQSRGGAQRNVEPKHVLLLLQRMAEADPTRFQQVQQLSQQQPPKPSVKQQLLQQPERQLPLTQPQQVQRVAQHDTAAAAAASLTRLPTQATATATPGFPDTPENAAAVQTQSPLLIDPQTIAKIVSYPRERQSPISSRWVGSVCQLLCVRHGRRLFEGSAL